MPMFSNRSLQEMETLHPDLQRVLVEAIKYKDFTVLQGHREKADQDAAYSRGLSKLKWPHSRHNSKPSRAVDIAPYPVDWKDNEAFAELAGVIKTVAAQLGIKVRWGGNWASFRDRPHFELG